jgi:hypothetical protein
MYETRRLFLLSDDSSHDVELAVEIDDTHLWLETLISGRECARVKIPLDEADETLNRLANFVRSEIARKAKERAE